jgi:phage gp36-like protein
MPDYTTVTKVTDLFPKISDTGISSASIAFYIDQAEAEINGKIAGRYTLPFSLTPPLIETIATELSVIKILDRFFTSEARSKNDWRDTRKEDLNKLLDGIVEGKVTLVNSAKEIINQRSDIQDIYSDTKDYTPTFNHLHYSLEEIDEDRLDDEEDALD